MFIDKTFRGTLVGIILLMGAVWLMPMKIINTYLIVSAVIIVIICVITLRIFNIKDEKTRKELEFELEQLNKKIYTMPAGKSKVELTKTLLIARLYFQEEKYEDAKKFLANIKYKQ